MSEVMQTAGDIHPKRLALVALLTTALAPVVGGLLGAAYWGMSQIPTWFYWKLGLVFLIATETAYSVTAAITVFALLVLSLLSIRRDRGTALRRSAVARGLLLCVSILIGLVIAEVAGAIRQARSHRNTVVPIGGLKRGAQFERSAGSLIRATDVELPTRFTDSRADRDIDVVVLGESSAEGVPYNGWLSVGAIVSWQLGELLPQRRARLHLLARMGQTLEDQHRRLAELTRRPDLLIVYCGHNEFASRFDPSRVVDHYVDARRPSVWSRLMGWVERVSPLCGLIRETADKCRLAIPAPPGRGTLVVVPAYTPSEFAVLLGDFHRRLEAIVAWAVQVGAVPVLIVPPANDAGFEPNRSFLPARTPRAERDAFERDFRAARQAEQIEPARALAMYRALLARQPGFAESHYRMAQLLERSGTWDEAYQHYVAARDLDGYPIRCLGSFQEAYRLVASQHGCTLVDGQAYFRAIGPHGLLDDHLFHDGMHPSLRGHIALAQAILGALRARGALGWPPGSPVPAIDPARCAAHFGMVASSWTHVCMVGTKAYVKMCRWTHDASERLRKAEAFDEAGRRIASGAAPESLGLPNVGIPQPVPIVTIPVAGPNAAWEPGLTVPLAPRQPGILVAR